MPAFLVRLIVLGEIPGTNLVLGFWLMVFLFSLFVAVAVLIKTKYGHRIMRHIHPFYDLPRGMSKVDLLSL